MKIEYDVEKNSLEAGSSKGKWIRVLTDFLKTEHKNCLMNFENSAEATLSGNGMRTAAKRNNFPVIVKIMGESVFIERVDK